MNMDYKIDFNGLPEENENELDVFIDFVGGASYVVTFNTIEGIQRVLDYSRNVLNHNWLVGAKDMIIIQAFDEKTIRESLKHIIAHEPYWDIFTPCNTEAHEEVRRKVKENIRSAEEASTWLNNLEDSLE
ncbi:MAG: hypothetical protein ACPGJS_12635 [Flammeovirgaceae bacterium]